MTTNVQSPKFFKVFRFALALFNRAGEVKTLIGAHWDGPHLVLTRGMQEEPARPSLARELADVDHIEVRLWNRADRAALTWRVTHEGLRDRGFLFMSADTDEVAEEAVCLLNAQLREGPPFLNPPADVLASDPVTP